MRLIVDANVLFSSLIKDSMTRKLIADRRIDLFAPKFLLEELFKYSKELQVKSGLSKEKFIMTQEIILNRINFVADEEIIIFYDAGKKLVSDKKDAPYVACALAANADLWSNDKHFQNSRVKVWKTNELVQKFYANSPIR